MMYFFANKSFRADFRRRIFYLRLIDKRYLPFALFILPAAMIVDILISIALGQPAAQLQFSAAFKVFDGEVILSMIILVLVPVNEEGVFNAQRPLATMQFLLTGSQFLLDGGLFEFSEQELSERRIVTQEIVEKALGAQRGSFNFLNQP